MQYVRLGKSGLKVSQFDRQIIDAVHALARQRGVPAAQIALAWHFTKPVVTAPIIGATKPHHLTDAVAATEIKLSPQEVATLESAYQPHPVRGFS